ncbi:doublecortin domain-containing protein 2-like isoform X1 [Mytilus californianus]|uniref:doublecortin domain-containing protein 2-like isoform X1 n=1 Tax=Mytilus californianus TaxID=6549 RepID=UPI002247621E|nr:doublecortin domain-containing protein 2-like isoform X1 [Mytilus californianus]
MRNGNYESEDEGGVEPHYQQGSTRGLYTYVYVNGDEHFLPKKLLVNPKRDRTYNAFLDYATKVLNPRYGAVRNIYTPEGRHRIRGFEDMQPDGRYVACGRERYKRLDRPYTQIEAPSPRRRNRHSNRDERLIPAHHNKHLENVTGKISQIPTQGKAIEVFVNGQDIDKPTTVGLSYRQLENMTEAIKVVHEAIREKHQYRVDQICDLEGHVVTDVNQLETGGLYVAKNSYHTFKPGRYEPHGRKNIIVPLSPRDKQQTKYLWKERSTFGGPGDYRRPRTLPPINSQKKHSPDHSVSSYPETRKRNQVNGVPVKAAKHTKRTPKQADYDKDDGGVFKAKGQSRDTRGAKEVRDNGDTKVDLPIDQVRAEEVKEEENLIDETEAKVPSGVELSRQPSESSEQQDERIKKERQGKDINNKPPTKQADHSHSKTMQNGDRSQADHSHSRTIQNGDRSQAKGDQSKPVVNNSQNKTVQNTKQSTYKSNSKAPPPNTTKNDVKKQEPLKDNDVKKQEPPKDNKNYKNHDSVRSSTPKDNKAAPPSKSPADKRSITPAKSPVNNKAASPARSPSPTKDKKDPTPHEEHQAATKIQANYRGHQARKEVNDLKTKKETDEKKKKEDEQRAKQAKEENQAATKIQAGFRGHQARKEINQKKQVRDVKNSKEDAAAIKIQSSYRGHKARKEIADKKVKRTEKNTEEEAAATKIQAGFRGHKARQEINQKKQQREETKNEEEKAATKIQAGFRGNQARKEVDQKKKEKAQNEEEEKAATKIQAGFRGHQARKEVKKKKTKRLDGKTEAITAIQAAARGFLVRRRIEKRENTRQLLTLRSVAQEEVMDILGLIHERDKAATTIQSRYRGYRDRKEYKRIKEAN